MTEVNFGKKACVFRKETPKPGSSTTEVSTTLLYIKRLDHQGKHKHQNKINYAKNQWNGRPQK
jgi:hypothetical protein